MCVWICCEYSGQTANAYALLWICTFKYFFNASKCTYFTYTGIYNFNVGVVVIREMHYKLYYRIREIFNLSTCRISYNFLKYIYIYTHI